jgi:hypothetical protein
VLALLTKWSYSQNVLIDKQGDTLVTITIPQMNSIYLELLQKDSLMSQSILNTSKETLLYELVDSAKKDINSLTSLVRVIDEENIALRLDNEKKAIKLKRNRMIAIASSILATILIIK